MRYPARALGSRYGALVMLSMPPASMMSLVPASSRSLASIAAFIPEPHILLTVVQPTLSGMPAPKLACRAGAWPWPAGKTQPMMTSCTSAGATPARSSAARIATAPSSGAAKSLSSPCKAPIGVLAAPTITTRSFMSHPSRCNNSKCTANLQGQRRTSGREALGKARRVCIRKNILDVASADSRFRCVPEIRRQQVLMVFEKARANLTSGQQKWPELLGEHIAWRHRVPRLGRKLVLGGRRSRDAPEVDVCHIGDFIVVVEHHAAPARDAEILEQHIAGKDVDRCKLLDGVAVIKHRLTELLLVGAVEVQIERRHAPLNIEMLHHQRLAVLLDQRRRFTLELVDQLRREARTRKRNVCVLQRVCLAPDAIVTLHQHVLVHDRLPVDVLGGRDVVADHFEHIRIRRQREDDHHQPANARRHHELIGR